VVCLSGKGPYCWVGKIPRSITDFARRKVYLAAKPHPPANALRTNQAICQRGPGKTFRDHGRVVAKGRKNFAQNLWLLGVTSHAVHLSLVAQE
jgi:hypothetical protein